MRPLEGIRIVVVEDQPDTLDCLRLLFEAAGAKTVGFESAEDALPLLRGEVPDVLVTDLSLPGINGCDLISRLSDLPGGDSVVAVVATAYASEENRRRCVDAGAKAILQKPIVPDQLISTIARIVRGT